MLRKLIVTAVLTAALSPLFAQETPATEPVKEEKKPLIISGFVDAYYRYDFSKNPSNNHTSLPTAITPLNWVWPPSKWNTVLER